MAKLPLSAYLVRVHEETGMQRTGPATADLTPAQWTSGGVPDAAAENKRLAKEGFREGISVQTSQGVSWAMQLGSASAARARGGHGVERVRSRAAGACEHDAFHDPRRSQRRGLGLSERRRDVLFREGRCLMLVGDDLTTNDNKLPVVAAAHAIWTRTHATPGPCAT
jgi:hypothetical protein